MAASRLPPGIRSGRSTSGDVEILREDIQGWLVESDGGLTVALDTRLDEALVAEGMRGSSSTVFRTCAKDAGFDVTDRITIALHATAVLQARLEKQRSVYHARNACR